MACLIDTGVLSRAFDVAYPGYRQVRRSLRTLWKGQTRLIVTLQNVAEFWNVSTRPIDKNGYGLSAERVSKRLVLIERMFEIVTEDDSSYRHWKDLLSIHSITGVAVHDARLVSVMLANDVLTILTLNERDFRRYTAITVITPDND